MKYIIALLLIIPNFAFGHKLNNASTSAFQNHEELQANDKVKSGLFISNVDLMFLSQNRRNPIRNIEDNIKMADTSCNSTDTIKLFFSIYYLNQSEVIPFASIRLKNSTTIDSFITTDISGKAVFSIKPSDKPLQFIISYIGCIPTELNLVPNRCKTIKVLMQASEKLFIDNPCQKIFDSLNQCSYFKKAKHIDLNKEPVEVSIKLISRWGCIAGERENVEIFFKNGAGYLSHTATYLNKSQADSTKKMINNELIKEVLFKLDENHAFDNTCLVTWSRWSLNSGDKSGSISIFILFKDGERIQNVIEFQDLMRYCQYLPTIYRYLISLDHN